MRALRLSPSVAVGLAVALAVVQAVQYLLLLPTWAHILISTVIAVAALYHLFPATAEQIGGLLGSQALAVIGLLLAALASVLPLIAVGSVWRAVIGAVLAFAALLLPGVKTPVPAVVAAGGAVGPGPVAAGEAYPPVTPGAPREAGYKTGT